MGNNLIDSKDITVVVQGNAIRLGEQVFSRNGSNKQKKLEQ